MANQVWTNNGLREQITMGQFDHLNLTQWQEMHQKIVGGSVPETVIDAIEEIVDKLVELKKSGHGSRAAAWQKPAPTLDGVMAALQQNQAAMDGKLAQMIEAVREPGRVYTPEELLAIARELKAELEAETGTTLQTTPPPAPTTITPPAPPADTTGTAPTADTTGTTLTAPGTTPPAPAKKGRLQQIMDGARFRGSK